MHRSSCFVVLALVAVTSTPLLAGEDRTVAVNLFAGMVTNDADPKLPGTGISSFWSYGGQLGVAAGDSMCQQISGDRICTYDEILAADSLGALDGVVPQQQTFWLHRVTLSVPKLGTPGTAPAGAGGRCNDWVYITNHYADGEFGQFQPAQSTPPNAQRIGNIDYYTDDDTIFTGNGADGHQCNGVADATTGNAGCAGHCGGAVAKAILCCYSEPPIFVDGFESGNTTDWSLIQP